AGLPARLLLYLGAVALTTLIAGLATAPFALFHFHRVANYSLVANLLAVPVMAVWVMPAALAVLALLPLGLAHWPLLAMGFGIDVILRIAATVAAWPGAVQSWPALPAAALLLMVGGGLWLCLWRGGWRFAGLAAMLLAALPVLADRPPDLLISADARHVAIRAPDGGVYLAGGRRGYEVGEWLESWGMPPIREPDERFRCDALGCIYRGGDGRLVSYARDPRALAEDCGQAAVLLAAVPVRGACRRGPSIRGPLVVDRFDLWRLGAHALWLEPGGVRIATVADMRGRRPWSPPPGRRRQAQ
ncbi:MAG TPA: ComEC/Rec2 family competence protein, partial [Alphaproteobacteria bacterium]|nr:ComEC/Rec2 family competence protein [Alphaproteobacteria bacterium]